LIHRKADILRFRELVRFAIKQKQEVLDELYHRVVTRRDGQPPEPLPPLFPTSHTLTP